MFNKLKMIYRPHWKALAVIVILSFIASFDGIASPFFLGRLMDILSKGEWQSGFLLLLGWSLAWFAIVLSLFGSQRWAMKLKWQIREKVRHRILERAYENVKSEASQLMSQSLSDVRELEQKVLDNVPLILFCIFQALVTFIFLMRVNWKVGLIFIGLGFVSTLVPYLTRSWLTEGTKKWQASNAHYTHRLEEALASRALIRRYGCEKTIFTRSLQALREQEKAYFQMNNRQRISSQLVSVSYIFSTMFSLLCGLYFV